MKSHRRWLAVAATALIVTVAAQAGEAQVVVFDPKAVDDIQNVIIYLRNRGIGILITDHNVRETLGVTDRAYIMAEGRIFRSGAPKELTDDGEVRRLYLGDKFRM